MWVDSCRQVSTSQSDSPRLERQKPTRHALGLLDWELMKTEQAARALAIRRAATMMGGLEALAERLNLPERQLAYWMRDIGTPPDTVFFDVIDIIIERAGRPSRGAAPTEPPRPKVAA